MIMHILDFKICNHEAKHKPKYELTSNSSKHYTKTALGEDEIGTREILFGHRLTRLPFLNLFGHSNCPLKHANG